MAKYSLTSLKMWALSGGFTAGEASTAAAIAMAESSGRSDAVSSTGARGLWQIMPETAEDVGQSGGNLLFNPLYNATTAKKVKDKQGWGAWDVYDSGAYKKYLPDAEKADPIGDPKPAEEIIPNPGAVTDGLAQVGAAAKDAVRAGQWIADPANLVRVVEVVGGVALVIVGLVLLARPAIDAGAGVAANVVTKGMAKKIGKVVK